MKKMRFSVSNKESILELMNYFAGFLSPPGEKEVECEMRIALVSVLPVKKPANGKSKPSTKKGSKHGSH